MTRFDPSLFIRRLVVLRDSKIVADLEFKLGLNVIAGENSSGKTTLIRFLTFSLGAENIKFNSTALLCDFTLCEAELSGAIVTLRRAISEKTQSALSIFWGPMSEALSGSLAQWQTYSFRRTESKPSFSQVLFQALSLPQLRGEAGNNVTMHQVMRLIYSDQETPGAELFRTERFDSPITRQAVGDYLLGIDDNDLYDFQLRAMTLEKEEIALGAALKAVYSALGKAGTNISIDFIEDRLRNLGQELQQSRDQLHNNEPSGAPIQGDGAKENDRIRADLTAIHQDLSSLKDRRLKVTQRISDAELLVIELLTRSQEIEESISAAEYLGAVRFSVCPCCLSDIGGRTPISGTCSLCNSSIEESAAKTQLVRMKNELALQVLESNQIKRDLNDERNELHREIEVAEERLLLLESQFATSSSNWRSSFDIRRDGLLTAIGRIEEEIRQLLDYRKLAQSLDEQSSARANIAAELNRIRDSIFSLRQLQVSRREDAYETVARNLQIILKGDIPRAKEFSNPREISFEFASNSVSVDGERQFSASSMVYLRHSFRLALLLASLEKPYFRFPRLLIIDGVEDGGMELERSHNFQNLISNLSAESSVEHQIIFATSSISAGVDGPSTVVGRKFSHQERSLKIL